MTSREIDLSVLELDKFHPQRIDIRMELKVAGNYQRVLPLYHHIRAAIDSGNLVKDTRNIELLDKELKLHNPFIDKPIQLTEFALRGFILSGLRLEADGPVAELFIEFIVDDLGLAFNGQPAGEEDGERKEQ